MLKCGTFEPVYIEDVIIYTAECIVGRGMLSELLLIVRHVASGEMPQ